VTVTESPEEVIRSLPDWHDATWSSLAGGLTNRVWLLDKDGNKAVLKIDDEPRTAPFNSRAEEATVQSAAASAGLANAVLFAGEQVYLTDFVDGSQWQPASLDQPGKIEQLAASLRRLHTLPLTGRSFNAVGAAKRYAQSLESPDRELVSLCLRTIRDTRLPGYLCCCHNDLVAENIVTTPGLKFLDWEYACDNDPLFDLATIVEHHELGDSMALSLLDAYFEGSGERWRSRLAEQQRLYLALYYLWMASRPESSEKYLRSLGGRLTTSCS
jgi:thiamine kinase-like enzyme